MRVVALLGLSLALQGCTENGPLTAAADASAGSVGDASAGGLPETGDARADADALVWPPVAAPGTASGRVFGRGGPLADAEIVATGMTAAGMPASFSTRSDEDGQYSIALPDGQFGVTASYEVDFLSHRYRFTLNPHHGFGPDRTPVFSSGGGIATWFDWRLSGQYRYGTRPGDPLGMHGGEVQVLIYDVSAGSLPAGEAFPGDFSVSLTLTPVGPLADGSPGRPVSLGRVIRNAREANFKTVDVPLGQYRVTAILTKPGQVGQPMKIAYVDDSPAGSGGGQTPAVERTFVFPPGHPLADRELSAVGIGLLYGPPFTIP